jgi:hypothetical protein
MIFPVTTGMLVAQLRLQISELVEAVNLVYLLVGGPCWTHDILEHNGTITDRVFPGTVIPRPYLQQGSRVLVYLERPDSEPFLPPVPVPIGLSSLDIAQAAGGWGSHSFPSTLLTQQSSSSEAGEHSIPDPDLSSEADSSRGNKRPRLVGHSDSDGSSSPTSPPYSPSSTPDNPDVSRRERAALIKLFRTEQRVTRRRYRASVRPHWDAEIADDKENGRKNNLHSPTSKSW